MRLKTKFYGNFPPP